MHNDSTTDANTVFYDAIRALRLNVMERVMSPHLNKSDGVTLADRIQQAQDAHDERPRFRPQ